MYHYKSDTTRFFNGLMADHPELEQRRLANHKLLRDVELNPEEQVGFEAAKVAKRPRTYKAE